MMQPVATSSLARRTPEALLALIARDRSSSVDLIPGERDALVAWCGKHEQLLLTKIEGQVTRRAPRAARRHATIYRRSFAARIAAAWHSRPRTASQRLQAKLNVISTLDEQLKAALEIAHLIGDFKSPATPKAFAKRKVNFRTAAPSDEVRILFEFGWVDRARQRLLSRSLQPFANFHPSQFMLRQHPEGRGRSAVCEYLRQQLPKLRPGHVFVQLDIKSFYSSIDAAWMERRINLPVDVVRKHVHTGGMSLSLKGDIRACRSDGEYVELVRPVLAQGSALSPLIAEMAMAEVLWGLADRLKDTMLVVYSDNLGIIAPGAEAAAIEETLRRAFETSGAGPFILHPGLQPIPISDRFRFLGHWWKLRNGELEVFVPNDVAERRATTIMQDILTADVAQLQRMRQRVIGQASEWRLWPGIDAWKAPLLTMIDTTLEGLLPFDVQGQGAASSAGH